MSVATQNRVIAEARADLGCVETPPRSNDGPCVNALQELTRALNLAWCASAVSTWWHRAGVDGIVTASTAELAAEGRRRGWLTPDPVKGSAVVWNPGPSGHTELFVEWIHYPSRLARTIGGNTGDAVLEHVRSVAGALFVTPPDLTREPAPKYEDVYWWEDPAAEPERHGLYDREQYRENAVAAWVREHGNPGHVRRGEVTIDDPDNPGKRVRRFTFWTGPRKRSPDYRGTVNGVTARKRRDLSLIAAKAKAPTHTFRPRRRRERV